MITNEHMLNEIMANRVVRRINALRAYAKHVEEWAAVELRRTRRQEERLVRRVGPQLEAWTRHRVGNGRRRSIALPGGTLSLRRQPVRPTVVQENTAIAWCRDHLPDAVELDVRVAGPGVITLREWLEEAGLEAGATERLRRKILNEHIKANGELPPGTDLAGGNERLSIS